MLVGPDVERALGEYLCEPALVLTIGNPLRGDDAAGPAVCGHIARFDAVDCGDAPERYLGLAGGCWVTRVLFVDAMEFGGAPGEVAFCAQADLAERAGTTHTTSLATLMRFVEATYRKPTAVLGIQPADTRFGALVCTEVREAAARVGRIIRQALIDACEMAEQGTNGDGRQCEPHLRREAAWTGSS